MALQLHQKPQKVPTGGEAPTQGYSGAVAQTAFSGASPLVIGAIGATVLGGWGIFAIGLGMSLLGGSLDWLLGEASKTEGKPPKWVDAPQQHIPMGSTRTADAPPAAPDYAAIDPGRRMQPPVARTQPRQAAARRMAFADYGASGFGTKQYAGAPRVGA